MENIIGEQQEQIPQTKKRKVSRQSNLMEDIIGEQEEQIPQTKKRKVSWQSGSMDEVLSELEETASSPCQTPLAPSLINHCCWYCNKIISLMMKWKFEKIFRAWIMKYEMVLLLLSFRTVQIFVFMTMTHFYHLYD